MSFTDLRAFLAALEQDGELLRVDREVSTRHEIAAWIRKTSDEDGPALLFENVSGYSMPVVGGLFAHRRFALRSMGGDDHGAVEKFIEAMRAPLPVAPCREAPCQEVVHTGSAADLGMLPVPTYCELDSGPFITAAVAVSRDPEDGSKNASIYRFEVQGPQRLGVLAEPPHHLGIHRDKAERLGRPLEVALALGLSPAVLLASQWEAPYGVDELTLAGALQGAPLEVVQCRTVDLEVPAHAEIVIEGTIPPGTREPEGPFGEYTGYYTPAYAKPVMEVSAITHRNEPLFQAMLTGLPTTENHVLKMVPMEASCLAMLRRRFPNITAVHFPGAGGVGLMAVVAMRQRTLNEARSVLATMLGAQGTKIVIVVDDDVDIYDLEKVMWAVCTRCQPARDTLILPSMMGWQLDPSAPQLGTYDVMGIDATRPFGKEFDTVAQVPETGDVPDLGTPGSRRKS